MGIEEHHKVNEISELINNGYYSLFDKDSYVDDYLTKIKDIKGLLFGRGSRGFNIFFTIYDVKTDWWFSVEISFEYAEGDNVIPVTKIMPFKPH